MPKKLLARETEIWGSTKNPSPVAVDVGHVMASPAQPCGVYGWNPRKNRGKGGHDLYWEPPLKDYWRALSYALFPFQGKPPESDEPEDPAKMITRADFRLRIRIPKVERLRQLRKLENADRRERGEEQLPPDVPDITGDVESAVWAWVNFGGLGARTRRGCGALACQELAPPGPQPDQLSAWLARKREEYEFGSGPNPVDWAVLGTSSLILPSPDSPIASWAEAVGALQFFRQGPGEARDPRPGPRPGRSRWPEPEAIREATGQRATSHPAISYMPGDAFPRAEFGLPIVFHFKQDRSWPSPDPEEDTELRPIINGQGKERMSSPLIVKPWVLGNGRAVSLILRLATPELTDVQLHGKRLGDKPYGPASIRSPGFSGYKDSPMGAGTGGRPRSAAGSALEAFLAFAKENGYREVTL